MGLLQRLKSVLGLDGTRSVNGETAPGRDVDVTVEREPSSAGEDAVKGTDTARRQAAAGAETDEEGSTEATHAAEPTDSTDETTPTEPSDEEPSATESSDSVTEISGIGPAYSERLADVGVETVADLAAADAEELAAATDISRSRIEGWIDAAAEY